MSYELPPHTISTLTLCRSCENGYVKLVSTGELIPCTVCKGSGVLEITRITRTIIRDVPIHRIADKPINNITCNTQNNEPK